MSEADCINRIYKSSSLKEALDLKKSFEKSYINPLREQIINIPPEKRKMVGERINLLKQQIEDAFYEVKGKFQSLNLEINEMDLSVANSDFSQFSFNFLGEIKSILIRIFDDLGFVIESGDEVVDKEDNFEALCVPQDHPSRSKSETFYIDEERILRPHCTVNSVAYLNRVKDKNKSVRVATIGNVYRRDDESPRHIHQFSQIDFAWISKGLHLGNLKWILRFICEKIFGEDKVYRLRNSYFPFTQPSFEVDMKCMCGNHSDCRVCKGSGWIEILGAGMFRKEILERAGYKNGFEGMAGGIGIERIALIKYRIGDIRDIYKNDFDFLVHDYQ